MIIQRNNEFLDQREFGNKENKAKTRAWRLQQEGEKLKNSRRSLYDSQEELSRRAKEGESILKDSNKVLKPGDIDYDTQREALRRSRRNNKVSIYDDPIKAKMSYGNMNKGNAWDYAKYMDSKTDSPYLKTLKDLNSKKIHGKGYKEVRHERAERRNIPGPNNRPVTSVDPNTGKSIVNRKELQRRLDKLPIEKQALVKFNTIKNSKGLTNQQKAKDIRHLYEVLTSESEGIMLHTKGDKERDVVRKINEAARKAENKVWHQGKRADYRERYKKGLKRRFKPVPAPEPAVQTPPPPTSGPTIIPDEVVKEKLTPTRKTDPILKQRRAEHRERFKGTNRRFRPTPTPSSNPTPTPPPSSTQPRPTPPPSGTAPKPGKQAAGGGGNSVAKNAEGFFKRNKKALMIGGGLTALGAAGLYGYRKFKDQQ